MIELKLDIIQYFRILYKKILKSEREKINILSAKNMKVLNFYLFDYLFKEEEM